MADSIISSLKAGSGIDTPSLVTSLVNAQFEAKTQILTSREEKLTAQISAVSQLKSGISSFASALQSLVRGGTLSMQVASSNTGVVKASALPGANIKALNSTIEVRELASAQVAATDTPRPAGERVGTGSFTIQLGSYDGATFVPNEETLPPIVIGEADATLSGIAATINAAATGVTASVITDGGGERLVLKGATGAASAFTMTATETAGDAGLAALNVGPGVAGTTIASTARDARVAVDGVEVRRSSNTITDLIPSVQLELQSVAVGTPVMLSTSQPVEAITQAVNDVVAAYNELKAMLKEATDPMTGPLARDPAAMAMSKALANLTLTDLTGATDGSPKTLAELGVATNRDGTLSVEPTKLSRQITAYPAALSKIFGTGAGASGAGLSAALNAISINVTTSGTGLGAAGTRYAKLQSALADEKLKATDAQERLKTRLTQQFASMDSRVAAYKATQTFMSQQIATWNGSGN